MRVWSLGLPLPTGPLLPGVWVVRDAYVNLFALDTGDGFVCVDAGRAPGAVARGLGRLGLPPGRCRAVLLTHSDTDHAGGLPLFTGVPIYAGEGERDLAAGARPRFPGLFLNARPHDTWRWVRGGECLRFGDLGVEVVPAPGHTPGSVCYRSGGLLFAGDALWAFGGLRPLLGPLNMDPRRARRTARLLSGLPGLERVFTAHSGEWTP